MRSSYTVLFASLAVLWCGVSASAETLRCQSVNGNLNCAGSGGVSCQTINGKTVCVSGHGDVVQSFGNSSSLDKAGDSQNAGEQTRGDAPPAPGIKQRLEQYHTTARQMLLEREATKSQSRSDWLSVDQD